MLPAYGQAMNQPANQQLQPPDYSVCILHCGGYLSKYRNSEQNLAAKSLFISICSKRTIRWFLFLALFRFFPCCYATVSIKWPNNSAMRNSSRSTTNPKLAHALGKATSPWMRRKPRGHMYRFRHALNILQLLNICLWSIMLLSVIRIFTFSCLSIASLKRSFFGHYVVDDDGDGFVAPQSKKRLASGSNWEVLFWKQPSRQLASLRVERSAGLCFNFTRSCLELCCFCVPSALHPEPSPESYP